MDKLTAYLKRPMLLNKNPWSTMALTALTVVFILAIFEPFNFRLDNTGQIWVLLGFVLTGVTGVFLVFFVFPRIFKKFYIPEKWTIGKDIVNYLIFLSIMGVLVVGYDFFLVEIIRSGDYLTTYLFTDLLATFSTGVILITVNSMIMHNKMLKQNLITAGNVSQGQPGHEKHYAEPIQLKGNTKDSLTLYPDDILYMEASGNYVNICYMKEDTIMNKQIRTTIKQMEDVVKTYPVLVRSHRAFIVNINKISGITGNALGYKITLENVSHKIPVSRTYIQSLKMKIGRQMV